VLDRDGHEWYPVELKVGQTWERYGTGIFRLAGTRYQERRALCDFAALVGDPPLGERATLAEYEDRRWRVENALRKWAQSQEDARRAKLAGGLEV